jgi:AbrB family looped-hinge helix DNA binding protein
MKVIKVTSKGQLTIPVEIRESLDIDEDTYLEVVEAGREIRLRKVVVARPLDDDDPIWDLVGAVDSGRSGVSAGHDSHLAAGEVERWRESSETRNRWPVERVNEDDEVRARSVIVQYTDKTFSYTDAASFAVMERRGLRTAFAFDPRFRQYGFALLEP